MIRRTVLATGGLIYSFYAAFAQGQTPTGLVTPLTSPLPTAVATTSAGPLSPEGNTPTMPVPANVEYDCISSTYEKNTENLFAIFDFQAGPSAAMAGWTDLAIAKAAEVCYNRPSSRPGAPFYLCLGKSFFSASTLAQTLQGVSKWHVNGSYHFYCVDHQS